MRAPQKSLKKWGQQKWKTSDGSPSKGKKRYLPEKAWKALSASEKAATNAAKAKGNAKGKQFVAQPKGVADKVKKFRAAEGGMAKGKKVVCPKCKGKGCSHCGGTGYHTAMNKGGVMKKKMNPGMQALKKEAPDVAKKMGYSYGGMAKKRKGYAHGGVIQADCGASMKPTQGKRGK
jgi:RecJ-like exonuclease